MVRIKYRYLLVNILYPEPPGTSKQTSSAKQDLPYAVQFRGRSSDHLNAKLLARMIRDGVADLFGDYGSGMVTGSLMVKYFSPATSTAIIRVARQHYRMVWAALTFTTRLPKPIDEPCVAQVVRVSGTIRKSEEEAIRRARIHIRRARRTGGEAGLVGVGAGAEPGGVVDEDGDLAMEGGIEDFDGPGEDEDD